MDPDVGWSGGISSTPSIESSLESRPAPSATRVVARRSNRITRPPSGLLLLARAFSLCPRGGETAPNERDPPYARLAPGRGARRGEAVFFFLRACVKGGQGGRRPGRVARPAVVSPLRVYSKRGAETPHCLERVGTSLHRDVPRARDDDAYDLPRRHTAPPSPTRHPIDDDGRPVQRARHRDPRRIWRQRRARRCAARRRPPRLRLHTCYPPHSPSHQPPPAFAFTRSRESERWARRAAPEPERELAARDDSGARRVALSRLRRGRSTLALQTQSKRSVPPNLASPRIASLRFVLLRFASPRFASLRFASFADSLHSMSPHSRARSSRRRPPET